MRKWSSQDQALASLLEKHVLPLVDGARRKQILNRKGLKGATLLHLAAARGLRACVKVIVDDGVEINPLERLRPGRPMAQSVEVSRFITPRWIARRRVELRVSVMAEVLKQVCACRALQNGYN